MRDLYLETSRKFFLQEAVCASTAFLIAVAVNFIFRIPHGYWIPMTVAVMFAMPSQGIIVQRSIDRMVGTIFGVLLSFFFLGILAYSDYRWTYLLPFIFFLMYYCFYISNNYAIMAALMAMFVPILLAMTSEDSMPLIPTLVERTLNTALGIAIALFCEYTIFRYASLSSRNAKHYTREYFKTIGDMIFLCNECFVKNRKLNKQAMASLRKLMVSITTIESLYINIRNELDFSIGKEAILNRFFYDSNRIIKSIRKMIAVLTHDDIDYGIISKESFIENAAMISNKYLNVIKYIYGRKDDYILRMDALYSSVAINYTNPTLIYLSELAELNNIFDDFMDNLHEVRSSSEYITERNKYQQLCHVILCEDLFSKPQGDECVAWSVQCGVF